MRASRILSLLLLLQNRGRLTAAQLAEELEVSVRTVYRDIEALHEAGVPLYGEAGHAGGYTLLGGYRTRLTGLTGAEAEALSLAGLGDSAAELGIGAAMATAQLKLQAALPEELRDRAVRLRERFHLDAAQWYREADSSPFLSTVAQAVWEQRRIRVRYSRWREPTEVERTLEPYGIVLKAGRWYTVARGSSRIGTYRVKQILSLDLTEERFRRPSDFDLAQYWRQRLEEFHSQLHRDEAVVRVSARGAEQVPHCLSQAAAEAVAAGSADAEGRVTATIPMESVGALETQLLQLGAEVEVLAPVELRQRLTDTVRRTLALYECQTS
ncbi:helix-turn-helix transcriptional regulator [Stackebrandtia nassauensis]|uniref:Helix-turn-helix type 11 domain protein n=1 Tax=Stackebrandtia nassauensis (strain DSM 44728 / CIP 108903 / NRRL B-16338 / NBRC 102104 / LLR-40K-21) TaxID=446470 RepID=D3PY82_STANL|nr:WYL domain-containing protein [Stackebrandtia nassauensis]ADD41449.1 Helix-turn-helix type 11 domain protein [Stackebrandtia nassauensis DSM 44728]